MCRLIVRRIIDRRWVAGCFPATLRVRLVLDGKVTGAGIIIIIIMIIIINGPDMLFSHFVR